MSLFHRACLARWPIVVDAAYCWSPSRVAHLVDFSHYALTASGMLVWVESFRRTSA